MIAKKSPEAYWRQRLLSAQAEHLSFPQTPMKSVLQ